MHSFSMKRHTSARYKTTVRTPLDIPTAFSDSSKALKKIVSLKRVIFLNFNSLDYRPKFYPLHILEG